jgi:tRNA threonylcarbamoyl adenosine modification protein YeaZ
MTGAWLGIETSGPGSGGVALVRNGMPDCEIQLPEDLSTSESILPAIVDILGRCAMDGRSLSGICVSAGPGSYTGLRVGMATATGLAAGWGRGVRAVPTLRVLAWQTASEGQVLAAVRARDGEVFAALFESSDPFSGVVIPPDVYETGPFVAAATRAGFSACSGNGCSGLAELPGMEPVPSVPSAAAVARVGAMLAGRDGFDSDPEPVYLRSFRQRAVHDLP